ncbi:hypothetical protein MCEMAEM21_00201 [Oxalobacteraceae bacterium]
MTYWLPVFNRASFDDLFCHRIEIVNAASPLPA